MSLTLNTNGARLKTENAIAASPIGSGGDWTKMTSVRPTERRAVRLDRTNEKWLTILLKKPAFGVAKTHLRMTRTPSIVSSIANLPRYPSWTMPVG